MKSLRLAVLLFLGLLLFTGIISQNNQPFDSLDESVKGLMSENKGEAVISLIEPYYEKAKQAGAWDQICKYATYLARAKHQEREYASSLATAQEGMRLGEKLGKGNTVLYAKLCVLEALEYNKLEHFDKCLESYEKAIRIFELNHCKDPKLSFSYKNAAQVYERYSNDRKAITYLEAALVSDTSEAKSQFAAAYSRLATLLIELDSLDLAKKYYKLGISQKTILPEYLADLNFSGAILAQKTGNLDSARLLVLNALRYYQSVSDQNENRIRALIALADIAALQKENSKAEQYLQKAAFEGKAGFNRKSREMAKLYIETGSFYEKTNRPDQALNFYQKALIQAFPNFNSPNINDNPSLAEAWLESQAMYAAAAKASLLVKLAETRKNAMEMRLNAAHCFDLSFAVASKLRHTYGNDADKIALSADNRSAYQSAALNLWRLWNDTKSAAHLEHLFQLIEQTKAQSLADALQQQRALALTGIPDSLLQHEAGMRLEAAATSKAYESQEFVKDTAQQANLKLRDFRQKREYATFIDQLGGQYPQFRQYAEAEIPADIATIRKTLPDSTVLLTWFDAGDRYLCLRLKGMELTATEVARDSAFDRSLLGFVGLCADLNHQQSAPTDFFTASNNLYQKLFPTDNFDGIKSLLIVPDGLLCYLPFEVLLTAPCENGGFAAAPYLIRKCAISYAWSAKLLTIGKDVTEQNGFAQFAPFAHTTRDQLAVLENSLADVPPELNGSVLEGAAATTDKFLKTAPENNVLHLSTHAHVGKDGVPGIEFFDRALNLPEIYAQRLHASLVTLSACETGAGRFAGGEGVLSLARAFAYAGAQSMIASLWAVNDHATATLFSGFYRNLKQGMSKSDALRQAKLSALAGDENDARKAPYYWAAFTLTGADGTVDMSNGWLGLWKWGLIILLGSMVIFWGFRKARTY